MANNRMWLVNNRTGDRVLLAKYYPSTGWYAHEDEGGRSVASRMNEKFDRIKPDDIMSGGNDWVVAYEVSSA